MASADQVNVIIRAFPAKCVKRKIYRYIGRICCYLGHMRLADNNGMRMAELSFACLDTTLRDIRYALRSLRRSSGFAITTIVSLTLGLGASLAVFTVADNLLVRPLPYRNASRLVMVWEAERGNDNDRKTSSMGWPLSRRSARCSLITAVPKNFGNRA